jgi:hypothetical protein
MPSLTVDVLLCVILLGGAYILFGRQGASTAASTSAGKKKKRSKASKGAKSQAPQSDNSGKGTNGVDHIKSSKAQAKASNDRSSATASAQATRQVPAQVNHVRQSEEAEEEDFPPLFSSTSLKSVKAPLKQIPLAERLAKPRPKTAVDDMVEKDDEWQGHKIYSRTMRIVKPQETEPLLLDEKDDEDWEKPAREQAEDSAWQSVPVASKSALIFCRSFIALMLSVVDELLSTNATMYYRIIYDTHSHYLQPATTANSGTVDTWAN